MIENSTSLPSVSLLVAVFNEADHIEECLQSLVMQDYPKEKMEVLIMDGGSTDGSQAIIEKITASYPYFKLLYNPKRIQSAAWNLGIQRAAGDVLTIVSGHSTFASDYVSRAVETLLRTKAEMVGGSVRAISTQLIGRAIALAISMPFGVGNAVFRYAQTEQETDTVFMGFCFRKIYDEIGGFDEELVRNQDDEFSYRLRKAGGRIICNPEIISYYKNRSTLRGLYRQYWQYGLYKVRVLQKHPRQMSLRHFIPSLFVAGLAASLALAQFHPLAASIIPTVYLAASLIFSSRAAILQRTWLYFFILPPVFFTLHIAYGAGFIAGLFKFWNRWQDTRGRVPFFQGDSSKTPHLGV